jgi:peptide/nickel transport system ATP-binding protein
LIFISHDLNLVAKFCDRIVIMYAGRIVETCKASELRQAKHPYTLGLLNSVPNLEYPRDRLDVLKRDPAWRDAPSVSARQ